MHPDVNQYLIEFERSLMWIKLPLHIYYECNVTVFGEYGKFAVAQPTGNNMAGLPCWVLMTQFGENVENMVSDEEHEYRVECWWHSLAKT